MSNFVLDMALRAEGLSEAEIATIEAEVPAIAALIKLLAEARPMIEQGMALYAQVNALYLKASPDIEQALTEVQAIKPGVVILLAHLRTGSAKPVLG